MSFTIQGRVTSANMVTRRVGNRSLKSESAREDHARIRSLAGYEAMRSRWQIPDRAAVYVEAVGSRLDADNLCKCILDGIKTILIPDDRPKHLRLLQVRHADPDALGERYIVTVEAL